MGVVVDIAADMAVDVTDPLFCFFRLAPAPFEETGTWSKAD